MYLVDSSQNLAATYRYDSFGNNISQSGTLASANVYRFSSKELHVNSGMYCYLYRFYHPNLQRWLNRDPLADNANLVLKFHRSVEVAEISVGVNLFTCLHNAPLNYCDPTGRSGIAIPVTKIIPIISAPVGILIGSVMGAVKDYCKAKKERVKCEKVDDYPDPDTGERICIYNCNNGDVIIRRNSGCDASEIYKVPNNGQVAH